MLEPFFGSDPRYFYFDTPDQPNRDLIMPRPERPRLGISLQPLSEQMASFMGVPGGKGVLVSSVEKGSVSEGKLKAGDVIVRADAEDVETPEDVIALVSGKSGGSIDFKVIRDKKEISVTVKMAEGGGKGFRL
jgi:serine protease Do